MNPPGQPVWIPGWLRLAFMLAASWFLGPPERALALDPGRELTQYLCQTWNRQNGLLVNAVNEIAQTKDGYLRLGTQAGPLRFDGHEFTTMLTLQGGRNVTSLTPDPNGGIWVGMDNQGFNYFDSRGRLVPGKAPAATGHLNCLTARQDAEATLWIIAETQLGRMTPAGNYVKLTEVPEGRAISGYVEASGRLWYGTVDQGLHYWQDGKLHQLSDPELDQTMILAITKDHEGNLWIGTASGLFAFDARMQRKMIPPLLTEIRALLVDSNGVLWIGTSQQGLARYIHGQYEFLGRTDGLASNYVRSLAEDQEGNLWIGSRNGLNQLSDVTFPTYPAAESPTALDAVCVCPARAGGVWVGSAVGLTYLNGPPKTYARESGLAKPFVKRILETTNGNLYLLNGNNQLSVFSKGKVIASYSLTNLAAGLVEDDRGVVVSVGGDLHRVGTNYFGPYEFTNGISPPLYWILDLAAGRDGAIWVASVNGITRIKDGGFQQWTTAQGLIDNRVNWVFEDKAGVVWAALATGIARIQNNQIQCLGATNGLFDNNVFCVVLDERGNLWVDAGRGIYQISRQSLDDWAAGRTNRVECTDYDGSGSVKQADRTFQENTGARSLDGRIWFPSAVGIVAINPREIPTNPVSPPVHLLSLEANGRNYPLGAPVVVPPGPGELAFDFEAVSYISPQKVRCRYQLLGFDPDWVETGSRHQAHYTNLKPGKYTFQVIAANSDGVWNPTGDRVALELQSHFYETGWFYGGWLGLGAATLLLANQMISQRQIRQQRAAREARERLETEVNLRTAELACERELLRTLLENSPDHIYFKDAQSRFIRYSDPMARRYGSHSPDALAGKSDFELFTKEHARSAFAEEQAIIRTGQPVIGKIEHETWLDGRPDSWVLTTKMPYRNPQGEIIGTFGISKDITTIIQAETKLKEAHQQLLEISRQAGMAEVATSVLHNVGNVLNSVNVSAALVLENTKKSKIHWVGQVAALLQAHAADLAGFLTTDPRGQEIPGFLGELAAQLTHEQENDLQELDLLRQNIEHIKEIVARQQSYSKISGVTEVIPVRNLVEDAVLMTARAMARHKIELVREYGEVPSINVEKHKVLQILINLIRNANYACRESGRPDKQIHLQIARSGEGVRITVADNGVGIPPENVNRVFNHGFTTRPGGHGFGLHSSALASRELGGSLTLHSKGPGQGATFALTLPLQPGPANE